MKSNKYISNLSTLDFSNIYENTNTEKFATVQEVAKNKPIIIKFLQNLSEVSYRMFNLRTGKAVSLNIGPIADEVMRLKVNTVGILNLPAPTGFYKVEIRFKENENDENFKYIYSQKFKLVDFKNSFCQIRTTNFKDLDYISNNFLQAYFYNYFRLQNFRFIQKEKNVKYDNERGQVESLINENYELAEVSLYAISQYQQSWLNLILDNDFLNLSFFNEQGALNFYELQKVGEAQWSFDSRSNYATVTFTATYDFVNSEIRKGRTKIPGLDVLIEDQYDLDARIPISEFTNGITNIEVDEQLIGLTDNVYEIDLLENESIPDNFWNFETVPNSQNLSVILYGKNLIRSIGANFGNLQTRFEFVSLLSKLENLGDNFKAKRISGVMNLPENIGKITVLQNNAKVFGKNLTVRNNSNFKFFKNLKIAKLENCEIHDLTDSDLSLQKGAIIENCIFTGSTFVIPSEVLEIKNCEFKVDEEFQNRIMLNLSNFTGKIDNSFNELYRIDIKDNLASPYKIDENSLNGVQVAGAVYLPKVLNFKNRDFESSRPSNFENWKFRLIDINDNVYEVLDFQRIIETNDSRANLTSAKKFKAIELNPNIKKYEFEEYFLNEDVVTDSIENVELYEWECKFSNYSFHNPTGYTLGLTVSQFLELLSLENCLKSPNFIISLTNDMPADFNYFALSFNENTQNNFFSFTQIIK